MKIISIIFTILFIGVCFWIRWVFAEIIEFLPAKFGLKVFWELAALLIVVVIVIGGAGVSTILIASAFNIHNSEQAGGIYLCLQVVAMIVYFLDKQSRSH